MKITEEIDYSWGVITLLDNDDVIVEIKGVLKTYVFHDGFIPETILERNSGSKMLPMPFPKFETNEELCDVILHTLKAYDDISLYWDLMDYLDFGDLYSEFEEFVFTNYIIENFGEGMEKHFYANRNYNELTFQDYGTYSVQQFNTYNYFKVSEVFREEELEDMTEWERETLITRVSRAYVYVDSHLDKEAGEYLSKKLQSIFEFYDEGITEAYNEIEELGLIHHPLFEDYLLSRLPVAAAYVECS